MKIRFRFLGHAPSVLESRHGVSRVQRGYYTNRARGVTSFLRNASAPQTLLSTRTVEVRFQNYLLSGAVVREGLTPGDDFLREYVQKNAPITPVGSYLSSYATRTPGLRRYELSQFGCAVEGAELDASLGLFVGAVGNVLGAWDEGKTWLLVGAMSAMGAAVGSAKAGDPEWSVRFRWEE